MSTIELVFAIIGAWVTGLFAVGLLVVAAQEIGRRRHA